MGAIWRSVRRRGLPLRSLTIVMLVISAVISLFLLYLMYVTTDSYYKMHNATRDYVDCRSSAYSMKMGTEYLSRQAQNFVITGNPEKVILYFNEVLVTRRRDIAIDEVRSRLLDKRVVNHLNNALTLSDSMMEIEYYAMRLTVDAIGDDINQYPEQLRAVELSEADAALTAEEKRALARDMVFNDRYETLRAQLDTRISLSLDQLADSMLEQQSGSSEQLLRQLRLEQIVIVGLMASLLVIAIFIFRLVIIPLRRQIDCIGNDQAVKVEGASELRFLARTYNAMFEQNRQSHEKLSYEATHDPLTGLYNRSAYDKMRARCVGESVALLLVDIDLFKVVNDTRGHDVGDRVLRRVAEILEGSFRGEDMVCRIGGDEFAVIMVHATPELTGLIRRKMVKAAEKLFNPEDGLPPVTLSIGVAFSDQKRADEDLFKNADLALYRVKEAGRNGCMFYEPQGSGAA